MLNRRGFFKFLAAATAIAVIPYEAIKRRMSRKYYVGFFKDGTAMGYRDIESVFNSDDPPQSGDFIYISDSHTHTNE